jgi:transcriptional regulator with XRE-family HTH domain
MVDEGRAQLWSTVRTPADLGSFLAEVRVRSGWTQDEVAAELGITRRYLYEIESGRPTLYTDRLFGLLRLFSARLTVAAPDPEGRDQGRSDPGRSDT